MSTESNVYVSISETIKNKKSKKSRVLIVLMAFFLPFGAHNYYIGNYIKAIVQTFVLIGILLFTAFLPIFLLPFYYAWITSEGLIYLLWYDVSDGNSLKLYDKENPPMPQKKYAILLAFLLPFGFHNIYQGNFKRGIAEWGFVAIIISVYLIHLVAPIYYISPNIILMIVGISWLEGLWMLIKRK